MVNFHLDLGWGQWYMGLHYHMEEALLEQNLNISKATCCPSIALFSKKYYNEINELNHNKLYDYCFIGSISSNVEKRKWVIEFAKKYFTSNSIFINTDDCQDWVSLGEFDYTNTHLISTFCPKKTPYPENQERVIQYRIVKDNKDYFEKMCQSKYVLCPCGDSSWSFRFYEVLMCKSLPIVETWHHTYRTKEESNINYNFVLYNKIEEEIIYDEYINNNIIIFENNHLIK